MKRARFALLCLKGWCSSREMLAYITIYIQNGKKIYYDSHVGYVTARAAAPTTTLAKERQSETEIYRDRETENVCDTHQCVWVRKLAKTMLKCNVISDDNVNHIISTFRLYALFFQVCSKHRQTERNTMLRWMRRIIIIKKPNDVAEERKDLRIHRFMRFLCRF